MFNTIPMNSKYKPHADNVIITDENGTPIEQVAWWSDNPEQSAMAAADYVLNFYNGCELPCTRIVLKNGQEIYKVSNREEMIPAYLGEPIY